MAAEKLTFTLPEESGAGAGKSPRGETKPFGAG